MLLGSLVEVTLKAVVGTGTEDGDAEDIGDLFYLLVINLSKLWQFLWFVIV